MYVAHMYCDRSRLSFWDAEVGKKKGEFGVILPWECLLGYSSHFAHVMQRRDENRLIGMKMYPKEV